MNQVLEIRVVLDGAYRRFVVLEHELIHEGEELVHHCSDSDDLHENLADLLRYFIVIAVRFFLGRPLAQIWARARRLLHSLLLLGEPLGSSLGLHVLERLSSLLLYLQGEFGNEMNVPEDRLDQRLFGLQNGLLES